MFILHKSQKSHIKCPSQHLLDFSWRHLVEADLYPVATMLMQALAGLILALEAWYHMVPEVFIDSMGYPFSLSTFRLAGCRVAAYVHYPTISCDMLEVVGSRQATFNNSSTIAQSNILSWIKVSKFLHSTFIYIHVLANLLPLVCFCLSVGWEISTSCDGQRKVSVSINARDESVADSWTQRHITSIWSRRDVSIVYPPCDVEYFLNIESVAENL